MRQKHGSRHETPPSSATDALLQAMPICIVIYIETIVTTAGTVCNQHTVNDRTNCPVDALVPVSRRQTFDDEASIHRFFYGLEPDHTCKTEDPQMAPPGYQLPRLRD